MLLLAASLAAPARAQEEEAALVVLLPVSGTGLSPAEAHAVEESLRRAIDQLPGLRALSEADNEVFLPALPALGECDGGYKTVQCKDKLGMIALSRWVVTADVTRKASGFEVAVSALRVDSLGKENTDVLLVGDGLLSPSSSTEAARVVRSVVMPSEAGALVLDIRPSPAQLIVDGETLPFSSGVVRGLTPGAHVVEASKEGFEPLRRELLVRAGEEERVSLELSPAGSSAESAAPDTAFWLTTAGASVAVLGLLVGGVGGIGGYMAALSVVNGLPPLTRQQADKLIGESSAYGGLALGSALAGGALVVAGGAIAAGALLMGEE